MENNNKRRDFIKKTGAFIGLGILTPSIASVVTSCEKDEVVSLPPPDTYDIDISKYPPLMTVGGMLSVSITLNNGSNKGLVIRRDSEDEFTVLDSLCRHQGCVVELPNEPTGDLLCPCHNVTFSFDTGEVKDKPISDAVPDLLPIKVFEFDKQNNILKLEI